jgi:phosphinothricin acetyltransferase
MHFTIEAAAPVDVPAIAAILNDAILNSVAAWREAPMTEEEMTAWFEERSRDFAVLMARGEDGAVLGYASYGAPRLFRLSPHGGAFGLCPPGRARAGRRQGPAGPSG